MDRPPFEVARPSEKLNRIVDHFARRPQVQERLTVQIAEELKRILDTEDVAVIIDAEHLCVKARGIRDEHSSTLTSSYHGKFLNESTRLELLKYIELGRGKFGLPDPRVNKTELACHVGAWMVFWPLYAVSLLFGDVIARVFDIITMMMGNFTNVITKTLFKDVFKV